MQIVWMLFPLPSSIVSHIRNDDGTMTGTGTEYASFIFTITLQHICSTFSASKIIIEYSSYFARVQPSEPVSPHNTAIPPSAIFAAAIFEMFAKKFAKVQSAPVLRLVTDTRRAPRKKWPRPGLMRLRDTASLARPVTSSTQRVILIIF